MKMMFGSEESRLRYRGLSAPKLFLPCATQSGNERAPLHTSGFIASETITWSLNPSMRSYLTQVVRAY